MAREPVGFYEYFLDRLGDWAMGIPLQSFWVIIIDFPKSINNYWLNKIQDGSIEPVKWDRFNKDAYGSLISKPYQNDASINSEFQGEYLYGCMFARSISIPGEKTELMSPAIPNTSGLIFPNITKNRSTFAELDISFIETNSSFVDNVIRPWNIIVSHAGLISRPAAENIKGTIRVIFYAKPQLAETDYIIENIPKSTPFPDTDFLNIKGPRRPPAGVLERREIKGIKDKPLIHRKVFVFNDVAPTTVSSQEYTQSGDALLIRPVKFTYSSYSYEAPTTRQ